MFVFIVVLNVIYRLVHNVDMNDPQPFDPRRRIRELMAIPERDRTDEQWDELNELEIRTAPGNRETERHSDVRPGSSTHGRRPPRNQGQGQGQKSNGPRPDARPREARPDARPQEPRQDNRPPQDRPPQEGRTDARPPKRQHRRSKRPPETPVSS